MATLKTPGVYVQEITKFPPSVAQVETAIPAFMGYTENAVTEPKRIKSMVEFEQIFGGAAPAGLSLSITLTDGVLTSATPTQDDSFYLYYSLQLYFANGGGPCYVVSTGTYSSTPAAADFTGAIAKLKKEDEPTLLVPVDAVNLATYYDIAIACLNQCNNLQDRFTIIDVVDSGIIATDSSSFRTAIGINHLKYGAAYYPYLNTSLTYPDSSIELSGAISGVLEDLINDGSVNGILADLRAAISKVVITLPPSAAIAGIYASVDRDRGVWKAPANVSLNAVIAPTIKIDDADQELLNVDTTAGKSINAIRAFIGKGTLVWGSRTLAGNDNEWRYVPVRRLFITVEESVKKSTSWAVFEPNDANTWVRIKAQIENYLTGLWKNGALAGATPDEAFFVAVGLGSTMTADDILNGYMNIEIGMAAVRPAEFIVLKFSHKLQTS